MNADRHEPETVTKISFESAGGGEAAPSLTIAGVKSDIVNQPEKIMQLMDILELPKGTNARILYSASDVVAR